MSGFELVLRSMFVDLIFVASRFVSDPFVRQVV